MDGYGGGPSLAAAAREVQRNADQATDGCLQLGCIAMNMKHQPHGDAGDLLKQFLLDAPTGALRGCEGYLVDVAMEAVDEYDGSGCAVVHTLFALQQLEERCSDFSPAFNSELPQLGLLVAGQGSRLWGISASTGFVKALVCLFRTTLFELTVAEARMLAAQAPNGGRDIVFLAGTDNIVVPEVYPLRTVDGQLYSSLPTAPSLTLFSKAVAVLDDDYEVLPDAPLKMLEQLGILVVGDDGVPIVFLEKVPRATIVAVAKKHRCRSVFFNAFHFAFSKAAARLVVEMYSRPTIADPEVAYFQTKGFDFSGHVLEAFVCSDHESWVARHDAGGPFPAQEDWEQLYKFGADLKKTQGPICVVNLGHDTVWYDAGMTKDLLELYRQTACGADDALRETLRTILGVSEQDSYGGGLVINSTLPAGSTVGKGAVVVNSTFSEPTTVPDGCIVINSTARSLDSSQLPDSKEMHNCIIYSYHDSTGTPVLQEDLVHFSTELAKECGEHHNATGSFPAHVNAKSTSHHPMFNHYNVGDNAGKCYLNQAIKGFPAPLSFKELFSSQSVSFPATLARLQGARRAK